MRRCPGSASRAPALPPGTVAARLSLAAADVAEVETRGEPRFESMAVNTVLRSAHWKVHRSAPVRERVHINRLEIRSAVKTMTKQAAAHRRRKQLYLLDSRVAIGVLSKGRSASPALNIEARAAIPSTIAFMHFPGFDFAQRGSTVATIRRGAES